MKTTIKVLFVSVFILLIASCNSETKKESTDNSSNTETVTDDKKQGQAFLKDDEAKPNVLNIAIGSESHTTLVAAVQAASLENALVNAGPLTVFAPTNDAFAALPEGTVETLLKPENKGDLAFILEYHVTPGNLNVDMLKRFNNKKLGQANNEYVDVEVKGEDIFVGGAKIIASVPAGNGIVHVIDKVMLPPSE
jgi:uncharacterized surface protein with fasciclin (FAS1) repeats